MNLGDVLRYEILRLGRQCSLRHLAEQLAMFHLVLRQELFLVKSGCNVAIPPTSQGGRLLVILPCISR